VHHVSRALDLLLRRPALREARQRVELGLPLGEQVPVHPDRYLVLVVQPLIFRLLFVELVEFVPRARGKRRGHLGLAALSLFSSGALLDVHRLSQRHRLFRWATLFRQQSGRQASEV
jgi:hypothetical protein